VIVFDVHLDNLKIPQAEQSGAALGPSPEPSPVGALRESVASDLDEPYDSRCTRKLSSRTTNGRSWCKCCGSAHRARRPGVTGFWSSVGSLISKVHQSRYRTMRFVRCSTMTW
jgi:hypothetical protein